FDYAPGQSYTLVLQGTDNGAAHVISSYTSLEDEFADPQTYIYQFSAVKGQEYKLGEKPGAGLTSKSGTVDAKVMDASDEETIKALPDIDTPDVFDPATLVKSATPVPAENNSPSASSSKNSATQFTDDFSNNNSGWKQFKSDDYAMGYSTDGKYGISLNIPNKIAYARPPYNFTNPVKNIVIKAKVAGSGGNGSYGLFCHFKDGKNYYRISFSGVKFGVDKVIDGQRTDLTKPYWKDIIAYQPEADGFMNVILACEDGRIQLLVNDTGQAIISDEDLTAGDAAIYVQSGDQKDKNGVYEQALFDDFSAELPKP
ncbi:MAG TPA: hypothetical protein VF338_09055, partial [Leptolinea sp.]